MLKFPKNISFLSLKIDFDLANSADPDEIPHNADYAAFHLGLHCLLRQIGANSLSFTDVGKSCQSRDLFSWQICLFTFFAKIKSSRKFPNFQYL